MKKNGFTLAEVLITLGIIGIVAAITLPALKANIDKNAWINGMKVNTSTVNKAFATMMAQEDVNILCDTTMRQYNNDINATSSSANIDALSVELNKYFKIDKVVKGLPSGMKVYEINGKDGSSHVNDYVRYYLANSSVVGFKFRKLDTVNTRKTAKQFNNLIAEVYIDTNGDKKPNTIGKDIHFYLLEGSGRIFPHGSDAVNEYSTTYPKWNSTKGCQGNNPTTDGKACTGRVVDEGYEMKYN